MAPFAPLGPKLAAYSSLLAHLRTRLFLLVAKPQRGYVFVDSTRVTSTAGDLSAEPGIVVTLFSSLAAGRVRQVPSAQNARGRFGVSKARPISWSRSSVTAKRSKIRNACPCSTPKPASRSSGWWTRKAARCTSKFASW
jgi:hypothetical protein